MRRLMQERRADDGQLEGEKQATNQRWKRTRKSGRQRAHGATNVFPPLKGRQVGHANIANRQIQILEVTCPVFLRVNLSRSTPGREFRRSFLWRHGSVEIVAFRVVCVCRSSVVRSVASPCSPSFSSSNCCVGAGPVETGAAADHAQQHSKGRRLAQTIHSNTERLEMHSQTAHRQRIGPTTDRPDEAKERPGICRFNKGKSSAERRRGRAEQALIPPVFVFCVLLAAASSLSMSSASSSFSSSSAAASRVQELLEEHAVALASLADAHAAVQIALHLHTLQRPGIKCVALNDQQVDAEKGQQTKYRSGGWRLASATRMDSLTPPAPVSLLLQLFPPFLLTGMPPLMVSVSSIF